METNIQDSFHATGNVRIDVIDKRTGKIVETKEDHNLIVKVGRSQLVKMLCGQSPTISGQPILITKMAVGSGGTLVATPFVPIAPLDGDTALYTPIAAGINALSSTTTDFNQTNPQVTFVALFDCSVVNALVNECALIFNDGTTMFARYTFQTVSLQTASNFSIQISWTIQF